MSFSSAIAEAGKTTGSAATMGKLFIKGEMTKRRKDSDFFIRNGERIVTFSSTTVEAHNSRIGNNKNAMYRGTS